MAMLKLTMVVHVDEDEVDSIVDQPAGLFLLQAAHQRRANHAPVTCHENTFFVTFH